MKITVYTITDCQFSKQEKEYLAANNLQFEEKNLELNREWLTEMLAVSNNFAGTPVTKIEKDDGSVVVLKGFTKEEFDQTLGLTSASTSAPAMAPQPAIIAPPAPTPAAVEPPMPQAPVAPAMPQVPTMSAAPVVDVAPVMQPPVTPATPPAPVAIPEPMTPPAPVTSVAPVVPPMPEPAMPQAPAAPPITMTGVPATAPAPAAPTADPLDAILNDLQSKVGSLNTAGTGVAPAATNPSGLPTIPDPDFKDKQ